MKKSFTVTEETFDNFVEACDKVKTPNEALTTAAESYKLWAKDCPKCGSEHTVASKCAVCHGAGQYSIKVDCPECDGHGIIEGQFECTDCKTKFYIEEGEE